MRTLVLASSSPYRGALLRRLGLEFETWQPDIDESPLPGESGEALVWRLSLKKAEMAASVFPDALVIGSDQVGILGGTTLNKPGSIEQACRQLRAASGQEVRFLTGLSVLDTASGQSRSSVEICTVEFRELTDKAILDYVERERPLDCAGSFKVEGLGIALFRRLAIEDPTALEGLPLIRLTEFLGLFGLPVLAA